MLKKLNINNTALFFSLNIQLYKLSTIPSSIISWFWKKQRIYWFEQKKTFSYNENEQTRSRSSQLSMFNSLLQHFFEAIFFLLYIKCILSSFTNEWQRQYFCNGKVNDVIIAVYHICLEEQFNSQKMLHSRDWYLIA